MRKTDHEPATYPPDGVMEQPSATPKPIPASGTFVALHYPNYRIWFIGQLISLAGTWMQSTAQGYLVFELTRSPVFLGYVGFAAGIPSWLFTLWGGLIADRISRRGLMVVTQSVMLVLAFVLAYLTFNHIVQPWHIVLLAFLLGIANAFDAPARQAFTLEMVSREHLTNAIALNATMFNTAAAVGPAIAGLVYAVLGPAWCFMLNGISFIAVIVALVLMKLAPTSAPKKSASAFQEIATGLRFVARDVVVRTAIFNLMVVSLFGISVVTLIPAWAVKVLGGDAATNGFLQSARGAGAVLGALTLASMAGSASRGKLVILGTIGLSLGLLGFSATRWLPFSLFWLVCVGLSFLMMANSSNALIQLHVPDELRGRVMSIFTLSFFGFMPLGALLAGAMAARIGEPNTVIAGSLIVLISTIFIWFRVPALRNAS